jgi:molybdopterin converting factor small subunit
MSQPTIIDIPSPLLRFTGGSSRVEVQAATVGEALEALVSLHPPLGEHLFAGPGILRQFIHVFVGEENIRDLQQGATPLAGGEVLSLVPAIAGGSLS